MTNTIKVEGFGSVSAAPDMMRFSYELIQDADSYAESHSALTEQYNAIVESFKKVLFNVAKVKTSSINVSIIHPYDKQPKQFRSSQNLTYEDKIDLDRMKDLLDALRSTTDFNFSLSYFIKDTTKYDNDAITLAVTDATDKAKVIASASGIKLGNIKTIEFVSQSMERPYMKAMAMDVGGSMSASELTVSQKVLISWEIK